MPEIRGAFADLARWDLSSSSDIPDSAKQWSESNARFERFDGDAMVELTSLYRINVERLNGQAASFYTNASNLNAGTVPVARLPSSSVSARGAVQLSSATTSTSNVLAATPSAVNAIRLLVEAKANATHSHGESDLPNATTSAQGVARLNSSTNSTSTTEAATPSAVRAAYNLASGKANATHSHAAGELPGASLTGLGIVQLNASSSSTSTSTAATPSAINAVRLIAEAKANATHSHSASDLPAGTTSAAGLLRLNASSTSTNSTQAATPSAVNAVRLIAEAKANASHSHQANDLPTGSTGAAGIVQLNASTTSTSSTQAATPSAVNTVREIAQNHSHSATDLPTATNSSAGIMRLSSLVSSTSTTQAASSFAVKLAYDNANAANSRVVPLVLICDFGGSNINGRRSPSAIIKLENS